MINGLNLIIDTGPVEGIEALSEALTQAEYSVTVAEALIAQGASGILDEVYGS